MCEYKSMTSTPYLTQLYFLKWTPMTFCYRRGSLMLYISNLLMCDESRLSSMSSYCMFLACFGPMKNVQQCVVKSCT